MKGTIHYDTGDTFPCVIWFNKVTNYIKFRYKNGEWYILGKNCLAENGIIRLTDLDGNTVWSLNPHWKTEKPEESENIKRAKDFIRKAELIVNTDDQREDFRRSECLKHAILALQHEIRENNS